MHAGLEVCIIFQPKCSWIKCTPKAFIWWSGISQTCIQVQGVLYTGSVTLLKLINHYDYSPYWTRMTAVVTSWGCSENTFIWVFFFFFLFIQQMSTELLLYPQQWTSHQKDNNLKRYTISTWQTISKIMNVMQLTQSLEHSQYGLKGS